jgi:hypothetical protein
MIDADEAYTKASPQPFDHTLLYTAKPPPRIEQSMFVLHHTSIFSLHEQFLCMFSPHESNLLRELSETGVRVP